MIPNPRLTVHRCPVCGAKFVQLPRGRPKVYDKPQCRRAAENDKRRTRRLAERKRRTA